MAYIDTSILVAYYCPEPLSEKAEQLIREVDPPAISQLTNVELCSALAIKVRRKELIEEEGERVLSMFQMHVEEQRYLNLPLKNSHYALAANWIGQFSTGLRTLDALHLALAFSENQQLITADKTLSESADHFGIQCTLVH